MSSGAIGSGYQLLALTCVLGKVVTPLCACVEEMVRASTRERDSHQQVVNTWSAANDDGSEEVARPPLAEAQCIVVQDCRPGEVRRRWCTRQRREVGGRGRRCFPQHQPRRKTAATRSRLNLTPRAEVQTCSSRYFYDIEYPDWWLVVHSTHTLPSIVARWLSVCLVLVGHSHAKIPARLHLGLVASGRFLGIAPKYISRDKRHDGFTKQRVR